MASAALGMGLAQAATPSVPAPKDVAYPGGTLKVAVDITDLDRRVIRIHETVPVANDRPVTLLLPKWLPGNHSPTGGIDKIAGLVVQAGGQPVEWKRDTVDINAFHVTPPAGAKALEIDFEYLAPAESKAGRIVATPDIVNLQWDWSSLYPAGYFVRDIQVEASVKFPAGWGFGSALETAQTAADGTVTFKPVAYDVLIDSPIFAGRYFKRFDLDPGSKVPVFLDMVADRPEYLEATPEELTIHRNLVVQADKLFASRHYNHYDFLVSASDNLGGIGLEHHRSSEDGVRPKYFTDWSKEFLGRDLLAHEYTHSWNGKFRRPADLWTPDYQVPMQDSLLWVYEGQTQYWGYVLAARSGLYSKAQTLEAIASTAAYYDTLPARAWRPLQDTTNDPIISERAPQTWRSWQRSEDYYSEGELIWLDADTLIREKTGGAKSLDNFAAAFFGVDNGSYTEKTYKFEDVVSALNAVYPYDWATFLRTRLDAHHGGGAPLDGLARGGYRLVYTDKPTDWTKAAETRRKITDLSYSLGLTIGKEGALTDVVWGGVAFKAGLIPGQQIIAVNGYVFDADNLKEVITAAAKPGATKPIELLIKANDRYKTVVLDYHGGLRYPKLERIPGTEARLDDILTARK